MILGESITIEALQDHLRKQGSGVPLDLVSMPNPVDGYAAFRGTLEACDLDRIFLWFEFRKHTKEGTAKLTDVLPQSAGEKRIRRFIEGEASNCGPLDLRTAFGFEPTLLTNDVEHGPLYAIDGNHRMAAQFLSGKAFDKVPVYVCRHVRMLEWAYITATARAWYR